MTLDIDPGALALFTRASTEPARDAVESLVACLQQAPEFGPAYVNLANLLRQLGLLDQARAVAEARRCYRATPQQPCASLRSCTAMRISPAPPSYTQNS